MKSFLLNRLSKKELNQSSLLSQNSKLQESDWRYKLQSLKLLLCSFFLACSIFGTAYAQNTVKLTGTVKDEAGPLPGVGVTVKGTTNATTTGPDGKYSITAKVGETLIFTMIGYKANEVVIGSQTQVNVTLTSTASDLNEVIVVGYGSQKKATLTGAVSSVTAKEIVTTKNENVQNMLTGKIAGVRVVQNSSEPGSFNTSFDVRGLGSPLVVVDGVVRNNFSRLSAEDIESITVLKDASAAIYGVRSANGVVLITTKKGKKGGVELNYNGSYSLQKPSFMPNSVNIFEYMTLANEYSLHLGGTGAYTKGPVRFTPADFTAYQNGTKVASDWNAAVLRYTAPQSQHDISASGGNENTNYYASLGVQDQEGFFKSGDLNYNRYNLRANLTTKLAKNLTFDINLTGIVDQKNQLKEDTYWVIRSTWYQAPTEPIFANNNPAYLAKVPSSLNAYAHANADISGYRNIQNKWFQSTTSLKYDAPFLKGLSLKGLFSYDYQIATNKYYTKTYNLYTYTAATDTYAPEAQFSPSTLRREFYEYPSLLFQASANYNKSFGSHNISALALYERNTLKGDNFFAQRNLTIPVDQLLAGSTTDQQGFMSTAQGSLFNNQTASYVGKFTYDYDGKYLAEVGFRADGSSKFSVNEQWGFFPYASAGYRVSEEKFWKDSPLKFVNNFKIRGSYGEQGDDSAAAYQFITGYNYPATGSVFNGVYVTGASSKGLANPIITWFTAKQLDLGVDVEMWKGLFGFSVDYFVRNRTGLLGTQANSLPDVVGVNFPQENLNGDRSRGVDLEVNHRNQLGDFSYSVKGIMGITRTMNTTRVQARAGNSYLNWENSNFTANRWNNLYWGYGTNGQFENYQAIKHSPIYASRTTVVGDYRYEDWNGDGVISSQDSHPISTSGLPTLTYGLTLNAAYKNWDFSTTISGAGNVYVSYFEQLNTPLWAGGNALKQFLDRYHPEDPNADPFDPNTKWVPGYYAYTGTVPFTNTLANAQNAKYFRIKTIELGYTLPQKWFNRIGVKGLRFYANAFNVLTVTDLKFLDPEHPSSDFGYVYPLDKKFTFGLNLKL
ncbi:MAG: TonB-dependent receptor [Acinetobacter sp.]|nr:MAG: TonB-dependent receptor [Acinetobacter sp.]